ncbi:MAG: HI0933-like protein [Firmicutes bacterium ADurb.Bin456]|nr:MAG: HI0933-like protein [Firmicutes bacterium ADurb.Bin456]
MFPASNSAGDVVRALQKHLEQSRVEVRFHSRVARVLARDGRVQGVLLEDDNRVSGRNVLIATGGVSFRHTGSTGDGLRMARELGHRVVDPVPALIPLVIGEPWVKGLQGLSLQDVMARVEDGKGIVAERHGDLLFTHFGVSGPVILDLSSFLTRQARFPLNLKVDLLHGLTGQQVEERLQRFFAENPGKSLKNVLGASRLAPQRMVPVLLELSGVGAGKQVDQVNRKERGLLARVMKNLALTVLGTRPPNEAIVTGGGIDVREVNPSTLESKIVAGLYFAGEILDTDALTGGYNLQIAFSTGYLSGASAARKQCR